MRNIMKTKKDLKNEYKQYKPTMGVFKIENKANGKMLLESSTNITAIWNRYKMELKMGSCKNKSLQDDWKEFGEDNFVFEIISEIEHKDDADLNYNKELKVLKEMVEAELNIESDLLY